MEIYTPRCGMEYLKPFLEIGVNILYTPLDPAPKVHNYAIDNGAFRCWKDETPFDEIAFYTYLDRCKKNIPRFVVIPDIVAGGNTSLDFSEKHYDKIPLNFPKYLAVQDHMTERAVNIFLESFKCSGIFVGGTLDWKRKNAERWCDFAHQRDLKCHIGRIGSTKWYWIMYNYGVDSVDGSNPIRNKRINNIQYFKNMVKEQVKLCSFPAL